MFTRLVSRKLQQTRKFSSSPTGLWTKYNDFVVKRPLLAKCITGGALAFVADIVCQVGFSEALSKKKYGDIKIDWLRALKFTAIGGVFVPPILHYWYGFLAVRIPGVTIASVLKRLALDQLCFAPIFLPCFISVAMILDGNASQIPDKLKADWFPTVVANYAVWVPCQFVNFRFVPPHLQVLWANIVGFFWNIYLSNTCYKESVNANVHAIPAAHPPTEHKAIADVAAVVDAVIEAELLSGGHDDDEIEFSNSIPVVAEEILEVLVNAKAAKVEEQVDKLGFDLVEVVDIESTLPAASVVEQVCEELRGEAVNNLDALVALGIETPNEDAVEGVKVEKKDK